MKIDPCLFEEFIRQSKNKRYRKICRTMLLGEKPFSLNKQPGYDESEYLPGNIRDCVTAYTSDKDMAITMFRDFVKFLQRRGYQIVVEFPKIPINSSFERQMYIAKYLQDENHSMSDLPDQLWVGERTLREDIKRLSGDDPIQVCGKKFSIPGMERTKGRVAFASTMHPVFLTENLTQIIVILKGLKLMSEDPLYENYATQSATEIWNQLSPYAKRRIRIVFKDILPEELAWYEALERKRDENLEDEDRDESFHTEKMCSKVSNQGPSVVLECIKNENYFAVLYWDGEQEICYKGCKVIPHGYHGGSIEIECNAGRKILEINNILRSAYTAEELLAD